MYLTKYMQLILNEVCDNMTQFNSPNTTVFVDADRAIDAGVLTFSTIESRHLEECPVLVDPLSPKSFLHLSTLAGGGRDQQRAAKETLPWKT